MNISWLKNRKANYQYGKQRGDPDIQFAGWQIEVDVTVEDETLWLKIDQVSELFQKSRSTINEHILNIYEEKELDIDSSIRKIGNSDFSANCSEFPNSSNVGKNYNTLF